MKSMVITTIDKSCSVRNHGHLAHLKVSKKLAQYVLYIKARQVRKTSRKSVMEDATEIEKKGAHG